MNAVVLNSSDTNGSVLSRMLAHASIEVTAQDPAIADKLPQYFAAGTDVHVTFLPGEDRDALEATCVRLRQDGYDPTPHLTARNFLDAADFEGHLSRLAAGAGVTRALVISGDVDKPRGAFSTSLALMQTGLLQKHGIRAIRIAGHPEGHPSVTDSAVLDQALVDKVAYAKANGLAVEIVTQFCFEAAPIAAWLKHIRALGVDVPVRIGVAGPASTATLLKFAMRCGIGNSVRTLRRRGSAIAKLMGDTDPTALLQELAPMLDERGLGPVSGIHIYLFGGMRKTADWLNAARSVAPASGSDPDQSRRAGA